MEERLTNIEAQLAKVAKIPPALKKVNYGHSPPPTIRKTPLPLTQRDYPNLPQGKTVSFVEEDDFGADLNEKGSEEEAPP